MRGHGSLLGAMDLTTHVARLADGTRSATVVKSNDSEEGQSIAFSLESVTIGQDEAGNPTTAPIVVSVESTPCRPTAKPARLPKAAQTALRALAEAIDEHGTPAPPSAHIPRNVKVVSVSAWRQQAYRRGISTSDEERAKQQAFKRASEYLIGIGRVAAWDSEIWLTS